MRYRVGRHRDKLCVVYFEDGERKRHSLGTADEAEAQGELSRWLAEHERKAAGDDPTVKGIMDAYVENLRNRGKSSARVETARKALGAFHSLKPREVTDKHVADHTAARRARKVSDGTIWTELGHMRTAINWAVKKRIIRHDDKPHVELPAKPVPRDRWLTKREVALLVAACVEPHVRLFIQIALRTGARMEAILGLTWDRVNFATGMIDFNDPFDRRRGMKGRAQVPMNKKLRAILIQAKKAAVSPFVVEYAGKRVGNVKKGIAAAAKRAGLEKVSAHVLRHTAATWMAERGIPMREIQKMLGHANEATTARIYAHHSPEYLKGAAEALDW